MSLFRVEDPRSVTLVMLVPSAEELAHPGRGLIFDTAVQRAAYAADRLILLVSPTSARALPQHPKAVAISVAADPESLTLQAVPDCLKQTAYIGGISPYTLISPEYLDAFVGAAHRSRCTRARHPMVAVPMPATYSLPAEAPAVALFQAPGEAPGLTRIGVTFYSADIKPRPQLPANSIYVDGPLIGNSFPSPLFIRDSYTHLENRSTVFGVETAGLVKMEPFVSPAGLFTVHFGDEEEIKRLYAPHRDTGRVPSLDVRAALLAELNKVLTPLQKPTENSTNA